VYLKKLELVGFKSFPEKTEFIFNQGITCIVGPNGCGKSNLLDALRWVLGEQKTSLLRGSKMEEVIFAGTRSLKPLGMAEVSLHVDNGDGLLASSYREVAVTRRLFRSGESEYVLNKVPCRLKDITDLFADTGIGTHAYAIIQQDMVDAILSDRTDDRRFLFEEAAGITKYKFRKKAAERKLEATEHDLLRLKDILAEVTTRVRSLQRQVRRAERYKKISDEIRQWDLFHAQTRYTELLDKRKDSALSIKSLDDNRVGIESQLDVRFAELEKSRLSLTELDRKLTELSGRVYDLSEKAHQLETDISVNREKKDNLQTSATRNREEIDALSKRADVIAEEKASCEDNMRQLDGDITTAAQQMEQAFERQKAADGDYLRYRSVTEGENAKLVDLEGRISSGRADTANIEEQISDLEGEIARHGERKEALTTEKSRRRNEIINLQGQIEAAASQCAALEETIRQKEKSLEEALAEADRLRDQLSEITSGYEATLARKSLLTEMVEQYEGYGRGVVAVFEVAERWTDITGTVADFIRPRPEFQTAVEAALGECTQYILCRTQQSAQAAVSYLKEKKAGRATFLILERLPETISRPDLPRSPGVVGWADTVVDCDEPYRRVLAAIMGRTVVCESDEAARAVLDQLPEGYRAVTMSGDLYAKDGLIAGGATEEISLIGRKDEIRALETKLADITGHIQHTKQKHAEAILTAGELRQGLARAGDDLSDAKDQIQELTLRLKEEQFKINAADEVITSIDQQIEAVSRKLEKLRHRQYTLALDFDQLDREKASVAVEAETKKNRLEELEQDAHQASEEFNRAQLAKIELESKRNHLISQRDYYDEMMSDIAANVEQKQQQIQEAEAGIAELTERSKADESALKELFDARQEESSVQQDLRNERDALIGQVNEFEEQVKLLRKDKEQIADQRHQAELALAEVNSRAEQLEERIRNEYKTDVRELSVACPNPELNPEDVKNFIEERKQRRERLGIVNLLALEEYEQQKERMDFLSRQLDDLLSAKATLKTTIQKINQTAKTMFVETMEKARANFKQMYMELFTGGEADVFLEDEENPLESRIEIISRPRGKKPLTIAQLSGGERALTAISLVFALYMVKPSPFCFLDEIDAPLDDVNIGRFLTIVQKFSAQTQFIIITHNKITMEAADTLYGVTMEEPGVSKVVGVRFKHEGEEEGRETLLDLHYSGDGAKQVG